jgi:hypothetical protein
MMPQTRKGAASAAPTTVTPIRPKVKVPKTNRAEDEAAIYFAKFALSFEEKAYSLAQSEPNSEAHRAMLHMAGIREKLPSQNLRLMRSTLDERRDFDLRCAELEVAKAEHDLESKRIRVLDVLEPGVAWWDSPTRKPLVVANNLQWNAYRARLLEMAETRARTRYQLDRKLGLIGKVWLKAEGDFYQRMRDAVAADQAWLDEHQPIKRRGGKVGR